MKILKKLAYVVSLILSLFYLGLGFVVFSHSTESAGKCFLMSIFWLGIAYINKKLNKPNISYYKVGESIAYLFEKIADKSSLNENNLFKYLYLADCQSSLETGNPLYPEAPWENKSIVLNDTVINIVPNNHCNVRLDNKIVSYWAGKAKLFHKLADKGIKPTEMVKIKYMTSEELSILDTIVEMVKGQDVFSLQNLVNETKPMKDGILGIVDLKVVYAK